MAKSTGDEAWVPLATNIRLRTRQRLDSLKEARHHVRINEETDRALWAACERRELEAGIGGPVAVAERLRDCLLLGAHREDGNRGYLAGQRWARLTASPLQLAIVAEEVAPMLHAGTYCHERGSPWFPYAIFYDI